MNIFIFVSPGEDHCLEETDNVHIIEVKMPYLPSLGTSCASTKCKQDKARPLALYQ